MALVYFAMFLIAQAVIAFAFYRWVIRPLPDVVNRLVIERHLANELTGVAEDRATVIRLKLLDLEQRRIDAVANYCAVKGKRLATPEERRGREALQKTAKDLTKQISNLQAEIESIYGTDTMQMFRKFEQNRFVAAANRYLDQTFGKRTGDWSAAKPSRRPK